MEQALKVFESFRPASMMLTVREYKNNNNEVSNFSIVFHVDYKKAIRKSLEKISKILVADMANNLTNPLKILAAQELIKSYKDTLAGHNPAAKSADAYIKVKGADGKIIKGIKQHVWSGDLHLWGFVVHKNILIPGTYPEVKSAPKTIEKNKLRRLTPVSKFRQYVLRSDNFVEICGEHKIITPDDL